MTTPPAATRPWVIITDYPRWPSPYFAHLHRHTPQSLPLTFRPDLAGVHELQPPGVLNLHRLKRLYHDPAHGARTSQAADELLTTLTRLRQAGWRLVWTVHNLKPIDGDAATGIDNAVTQGVLDLADIVLCHTSADAVALRCRTSADVRVVGWAGLDDPEQPPSRVLAELRRATADAGRRVIWHPHRVSPQQAGHLYAAAHAAVCPYRTDEDFGFFADVLHPSSVTTATCYQVPVVAPGLPAIEEITRGRPRWLTPARDGLGPALAAAEAALMSPAHADMSAHRPPSDSATRWQRIGRIYQALAAELLPDELSATPTPTGEHHR